MSDSAISDQLFVSPREYFSELVDEALSARKIQTDIVVSSYLVDLMEFYMDVRNLYDSEDERGRLKRETLAEMFLKANTSETASRIELLKKLGDSSLYISGFFGDSLQRKIVDIDYYVDMGCTAYSALADCVKEESFSRVYREFSKSFSSYVDVLAFISHRSFVQSNENILRLYERYLKTGSELAREKLAEMGLPTDPENLKSSVKQ